MRDRGLLASGLVLFGVLIGYRAAEGQGTAQSSAATSAPPAAAAAPEAKQGSAEDLQLLGIVRGAASAGALIGFDGKQEIFRKGDTVFDHGTLKDVRDDSVVIHSGGNDVTLKVVREAT